MWNWQVTPQLDLTNAVRLDHLELSRTGRGPSATTALAAPTLTNADFNDRSFTKLSANSGAVYKLTDVDTLRASFGRGMQIPSLYEYALLQSATVAWKAGNPDLNPSVVTNYELGYTRDLPDYHTKVTTSLFYQTNDDLVSYPNFAASGATLKYVNVGNSDAWGWELGVDGKNGNWRWGGNYRLEYISDHLTVNSSGLAYPILYEGGAPHNLLTGRVGYTLDRWDFDLFGRYSTSYQMPVAREVGGLLYPVYTVPSYATLDARVAFNVTDKAWIAVSATNLQAEKTIYTSGPAVERQAFVTVGMKF
jgi:iron complex outermembrane receptor protein